jgi:hypothetical protein
MKRKLTITIVFALFILILNAQNNTKSLILSEDFSSHELPNGWKNIDNTENNAGLWLFNNPGEKEIHTKTADNGFAIFDSDYQGNDDKNEDCDLISPVLNCSDKECVMVSFDHYFKDGYDGACKLYVSNDAGVSWNLVESWNSSTENAETAKIDISEYAAGKAEVKIKWNWVGDFSYFWAIDDVSVFEPEQHDFTVTDINPDMLFYSEDTIPSVTVRNVGLSNETEFTVSIEIVEEVSNVSTTVYSDEKTISDVDIAPDEYYTILFDNIWEAPSGGVYAMKANVNLATDVNNSNDNLETITHAIDFTYDTTSIYGYITFDPENMLSYHYVKINIEDGMISDLVKAENSGFINGGDFVDGIVAAIEYGSRDIYYINGDGSCYRVTEAVSDDWLISPGHIVYDATTDSVYLTDWDSNSHISNLYRSDKRFKHFTKVGEIGKLVCGGLACDNNGDLFGISTANIENPDESSSFLSINKQTGEATRIGYLGDTISFIQDIGYDRNADKIYGTLYMGNGNGGLYEINRETGVATLIETFPYEITLCAIPKHKGINNIVSFNGINHISVYPNPTTGIFNIYSNQNYFAEVIDMTGRIINQTQMFNKFGTIDLTNQKDGVYIIKLTNNKRTYTYKVVKN